MVFIFSIPSNKSCDKVSVNEAIEKECPEECPTSSNINDECNCVVMPVPTVKSEVFGGHV